MAKRLIYCSIFCFIFAYLATVLNAYTVVLKNGKVMKGTLISETTDAIVFKDDTGVQFSLKKAGLDLEKMKEANDAEAAAAAASPAPAQTPEQPPAAQAPAASQKPDKKPRVYTKEDLDKLKERYGELTTGTPIENPEDFASPGVLKPQAYLKRAMDAANTLTQIMQGLDVLGAGVSTQWEVAASTGKNATESIQTYMKGESAAEIINNYTNQIAAADEARERLGTPPRGYEPLKTNLDAAVSSVRDYYELIRGYAKIQNSSTFKNRLDEVKAKANADVSNVQSWQPPAGMPQEPAQPTQTNPSDTEQQTQQ